jgi:hypothetical protein
VKAYDLFSPIPYYAPLFYSRLGMFYFEVPVLDS